MGRSFGLLRVVARDGGEARKAVVIRWRKGVLARGDTTLARKASGAGRIELSAVRILIRQHARREVLLTIAEYSA